MQHSVFDKLLDYDSCEDVTQTDHYNKNLLEP